MSRYTRARRRLLRQYERAIDRIDDADRRPKDQRPNPQCPERLLRLIDFAIDRPASFEHHKRIMAEGVVADGVAAAHYFGKKVGMAKRVLPGYEKSRLDRILIQ